MLVAEQQCTRQEETATSYIKAPNNQPKKKGLQRLIGLIGVNLVILICSNLVIHGLLLQQNYQGKALGDQIKELDRQLLETQMEISSLGSFERIQEVAVTRLGMQLPERHIVRPLVKNVLRDSESESALIRRVFKPVNYQNNLWSEVVAWLSSLGATMAQEH